MFLGAALALTVQSVVAIVAGRLLALLPPSYVHLGSGASFLVFAIVMWRRKPDEDDAKQEEEAKRASFARAFFAVFGVVFIAEWGDLTQLATAALAARYGAPAAVFVGATTALWAVAAIAVLVGRRAGKLLDPQRTKKVAAVVFAVIGALLVAGSFGVGPL